MPLDIVLVTGGSGFMGHALYKELVEARYPVYSYDLKWASHNTIRGDVCGNKFTRTLQKIRPEIVYHLAAEPYIPSCYDFPEQFIQTNLLGTLNVLQACLMFGVEKVIYYSSSEVYGTNQTGKPMTEEHPTLPSSIYAMTKLAADQLCRIFSKETGLPIVILRCFNAYGPHETHPYIIPEIISQLAHSSVVTLGNVDATRDFTYVEDVAKAAVLALKLDSGTYNIGTGEAHTILSIFHALNNIICEGKAKLATHPSRLRPFDVDRLLCDSTKFRKATGWTPKTPFAEGLRETVAWYKQHGWNYE